MNFTSFITSEWAQTLAHIVFVGARSEREKMNEFQRHGQGPLAPHMRHRVEQCCVHGTEFGVADVTEERRDQNPDGVLC